MKRYEGKEVCQGCGKTGAQKPRARYDSLCESCLNELIAGRHAKDIEVEPYTRVNLQWYYFGEIHDFAVSIFEALHKKNASPNTRVDFIKGFGDGRNTYDIPTNLVAKLHDWLNDMQTQKANIKKEVSQMVASEKDAIYTKGVNDGRNLLFALNNGDITMNQFTEKLKYERP